MSEIVRGHGRLTGLRGAALTAAIRDVVCPRCGSARGRLCTMHGVSLPVEHLERMDLARAPRDPA